MVEVDLFAAQSLRRTRDNRPMEEITLKHTPQSAWMPRFRRNEALFALPRMIFTHGQTVTAKIILAWSTSRSCTTVLGLRWPYNRSSLLDTVLIGRFLLVNQSCGD